jgi:hypothetical protein
MFMLEQVKTIYTQLEGIQKCIFVFWMSCVVMLMMSFVYLIVLLVKNQINKFYVRSL